MLTNKIRQKLSENQVVLGSWITFADTAVAEIMSRAGFDWLTVDMEHSPITLNQAQELIRVISLCGVTPLVRLPSNDPVLAGRVMDAGASGTIVPMVNSRRDAEDAVRAVKYPPEGKRSVGLARAQGYGTHFETYVSTANSQSLVIVQIEHIDAVANIESILSVDGVDGFIIGPYDLTGSMGIPGALDHPRVLEALQRLVDISRSVKVPAGIHVVLPAPEEVFAKAAQGFRLIAYSVDFLLLGNACRRDVQEINRRLRPRNEA